MGGVAPPVQVNVSSIREQKGSSLPVQGEVACPPLEVEGSTVEPAGPVQVRGVVTNTGKGYLVQADLDAAVQLECTRCLEVFTLRLRRRIQEMFYPERLRDPKLEAEEVVNYYSHDVLDLSEVIRENLQLALPMKRVCRPQCQGLCPVCGHNLNQGDCGCPRQPRDGRWAVLGDLLSGSVLGGNGERKR